MSDNERSRRRLLTGGAAVVGTAAGAVLLGRAPAEAANGDPIRAGQTTTATAATSLTNTSASGGAHGLLISTKGGYGFQATSTSNHGVAGITSAASKAGVVATHNGPAGTGSALSAAGRKNTGALVYNADSVQPALVVKTTRSITGGTTGEATGAYINAFSQVETDWPTALRVTAKVITPEAVMHDGTALEANGHVEVNGSLTKSSGSFRIDHPLDPANKYLFHSFVESPDMANVYNGTVVADANGQAVVELPEWFDALNKDLRYQLTPIGAPAPDLHVKSEVADGRFAVAGAKAGQKVSWQVVGTRQDAWANANRVPVERDKPAKERGTYLFPRGFGKPESQRLGNQ